MAMAMVDQTSLTHGLTESLSNMDPRDDSACKKIFPSRNMISEIHFSFIQDTRLADTLDDRSGIVVESDQNMDGYFIQRYIIHKCDIIIHDTRLADTLDNKSGIVVESESKYGWIFYS